LTEDSQFDSDSSEAQGSYRFLGPILYFLFAVGPLVSNAVLVLLGAISADFVVNPTAVLIAYPAFMFPFAILQLFSGAISDVYGRVVCIVGGLVIFIVGIVIITLSTSIELLAIGNLVAGIGFGFANPALLALLSDSTFPEDIPRRMGIASALATFGVGLGPFIAGQMVVLGWQSYYILFLIIVIISTILLMVTDRPPKRVHGETGIRVFLSNLGTEIRRPIVILMLLTAFMVSLTYMGTLIWTSRGLTGALDETLIGVLLLCAGISSGVAGFLLGSIVRRYSYEPPLAIGFVALLGGASILILAGDITLASSTILVLLGLVAVGWGGGLLFPIVITYSQVFSPERRGVLTGVVTFAFFLGLALIPSIYEPLFNVGMTFVYVGILLASIILMVLFVILHRALQSNAS